MRAEVIIIGAGASGLMCAIEAGKRGRSVLVLEHTDRLGSKIRISGGGRCNFTNLNMGRENYLSNNPHFVTSALSRFTPLDFTALLERNRIGYHEEEDGRLFCDRSALDIVNVLKSQCDRLPIKFHFNCNISEVQKDSNFHISTDNGLFSSGSLVIASGGLSYPNLGASNLGYEIARRFGLKVTKLKPGLTPLRFRPDQGKIFKNLAGISIDCMVSHGGAKFRGNVLFTHKGLSGPAILQVSSYWEPDSDIVVDLLPSVDISRILEEKRNTKLHISTILEKYLPNRFVKVWRELNNAVKTVNQCSPREIESLAEALNEWRLRPIGTEGFNKAEVTLGGVDTNELSSKTMESKKVPGLYFLGEVVDVTGHLGGYNLHWAWASGYAAGQYV